MGRDVTAAWRVALRERALELRAMARALVRPEPAERRLDRAARRAFSGAWAPASTADLRKAARAARVVLIGDHRALPSLSARVAEVLDAFGGAPVLVGLGRAARADEAARAGLRAEEVIPLDTTGDLDARLRAAAGRVARAARRRPGARVVLVVGELLLAPTALPAALAEADPRLAPDLFVHRDPEPLFEAGLETPRLLRQGRRFASLETAPMWQDDAFVARCRGERMLLDPLDVAGSFRRLLARVAGALGVRAPAAVSAVPVRLATEATVPRLLARLAPEHAALALEELRRGESFFLARPRCVVLSSLAASDAAEEAAHLLRSLVGGSRDPRRRGEALYARALHEAIGFAGAAMTTGRREAPDERAVRRLARTSGPLGRGARLALRVLALEAAGLGDRAVAEADGAPDRELLVAAHLLGYGLGPELCRHPTTLRALLREDLSRPGAAPRRWRALAFSGRLPSR